MKIRCLLVDDEPPALKILERYVTAVNGLEIVGMCSNALEALEVLRTKTVDLIFLDIKMPSIIGTDFLRTLTQPPKIIFVTAYREYAVDGFELDALDYLVKPVSFERFLKAISRLHRQFGLSTTTVQHANAPNPAAFVYLKVDKDMKKIYVNDIAFVESWKDYVRIYYKDGKYVLVKQAISSLENLLSEHKFLRVHRSYIVSLKKITGYKGASVLLQDQEIPIGRLYKQAVKERLHQG